MSDGDLLTDGTSTEQPASGDNQSTGESGESGATPVSDDSNRPGWMDQLSGDLKVNKALYKFKSASDAVKSLVELEGKLGKSVTVSETPTEEELSRVRTLLGVPKDSEGYDFTDVELPEGFKLTDGAAKDLKEFAHENDMTVPQAKKLLAKLAARENEAVRQVRKLYQEKREKAEAKLRQDLGADYDKHYKASRTWLETYGDDELKAELKDTGFGNSPALIRALAKSGLAISEGQAPRGGPGPAQKTNAAFPVAAQLAAERTSNYD